jgi:hypothetical protein
VATTTAYLYGVGLFVSRGVVPVLNITSAEMCASYADRRERGSRGTARGSDGDDEDEARGKPRQEPPPQLSSAASNIRCTSRRQISHLPPAASVRASKERSCTRSFPFSTSEAKGCVSNASLPAVLSLTLVKVSAAFPALLADVLFYSAQFKIN